MFKKKMFNLNESLPTKPERKQVANETRRKPIKTSGQNER